MQNILLGLLVVVAVLMIVLGAMKGMMPPMLTGVGFLLITALFLTKKQ